MMTVMFQIRTLTAKNGIHKGWIGLEQDPVDYRLLREKETNQGSYS